VLARLSAATAQMIAAKSAAVRCVAIRAQAVFLQRIAAAGIPRSKAQKSVQQAERNGHDDCFVRADFVGNGEEVRDQPRDRNPRKEVD